MDSRDPHQCEVHWKSLMIKPFEKLCEITKRDIKKWGIVDPNNLNSESINSAKQLEMAMAVERVRAAIERSYEEFKKAGHEKFPDILNVGIYVSDDTFPIHRDLNRGFTGFGGIPGFIILILSPTEFVLKKLEALTAHEFHHNIRYMMDPWPADNNISVGKYLIDEGMAEVFAARLYGEESLGHWSTGKSQKEIQNIEEIIRPHVDEVGFLNASSYLFGDDMAEECHYTKRGLPHGAGYAMGYQWVKEYLARSHKTIVEATAVPAEDLWKKI